MGKRKDYTGQIINGYLLVEFKRMSANYSQYYLMRCIKCGYEKIASVSDLKRKNKKICPGCREKYLKEEMIGKQFGRLTVILYNKEESEYSKSKNRIHKYNCICSCGNPNIIIVHLNNLERGSTQSCGCLQKEKCTLHGYHGTKVYRTYHSMKQRCYNPNNVGFENYGGRNITICDEWLEEVIGIIRFCEWAVALDGNNPKLEIDRIDKNGNYTPDNCRFVKGEGDNDIQDRNKRTNRAIKITNTETNLVGYFNTIAEGCEIIGMIGRKPSLSQYKNNMKFYNEYKIEYYDDDLYQPSVCNPIYLRNPISIRQPGELIDPIRILQPGELMEAIRFVDKFHK